MTSEERLQIAKNTKSFWFLKRSYLEPRKELSFSYMRYRILRPLLKIYYRAFRALNYPTPWIAPRATAILEQILTKDLKGLEYGSGISSVFLAQRIGHLVSIEHYESWYQKVGRLLKKYDLSNTDRQLVKPDKIKKLPHKPTKPELHEMKYGHTYLDYADYANAVRKFPDKHFDFVLIDGRSRVECMRSSLAKVKKGGFIILDNSERSHYDPIHQMLEEYPKVFSTTGLSDTIIWFKPD